MKLHISLASLPLTEQDGDWYCLVVTHQSRST